MECIQKLLLLIIVLILGFHTYGCFGCHKEEREALLHLKFVINHPNGKLLATWNEEDMGRPSNCCNWERVSCGARGHVVSLSLDSLRQGEAQRYWYVNASVFLPFQHLQVLDLSYNSITGWTEHLRQLSSLKKLYLTFNKLRGIIDLYDLEALENLELLDLSYNSVDGFQRINGTPRNRSNLKILFLYNIAFHDPNMLLNSLLAFPSLKYLYLMNNDFRGAIKTNVPQALRHVEVLLLSGSSLSQNFLQSLGAMVSLKDLMVDSSALNGDISSHEWLCQLKKLQFLDIGQNDLQGQLPSCFGNLTSLQHLDLRQNNLHGKFPLSFSNLTSLQFFDLTSNQFVGNIANSPLTKLTSLHVLSMSNNMFQIPQAFRSFSNHSSLKVLWLDGNTIVPDLAPQPFIPKFQLLFLSLSNCSLGATIPDFIHHQYNLRYLDLSHNNFVGNFPSWVLENNTRLGVLLLAHNLFLGSLHMSRHPHFHITALDVSCNNISYLSANLSLSSPNIAFLNFSGNSIKGVSPSNFGDMEKLGLLDLSYNHLAGEMPKNLIRGCLSLEILILSHNSLEVIPSLSSSSFLRILRLSDNNFSGMIPSSLFATTSLASLDISNNHLGGQIPLAICNLNLIFLDLSNNNLSGPLPFCFNTKYLRHVYLNKNNLDGSLLHVFRNSTSLVTLDISDNHSFDVIPEWIGDLRNRLSVLSLRNNHFVGHIPSQLCSLDQLTILDLSNNNISGQIPHCLSQMSFQPLEVKSFDTEGFLDFPQVNIDEMSDLSVTEETYLDSIRQDFIVQHEMEITTKSHTYTYVGIDLDGMSVIDLSCNKLSGEIPPRIGTMIGVRALNLSHNELTGSIPSTLSKLVQIESLDLSYNSLSGSIPLGLIQLNALAVFTVAHNNLSGRIPEPKAQFATFGESSYEGNVFLCGPPLVNECSTPSLGVPGIRGVKEDDGLMDVDIFYESFMVSSVIIFFGTLIVLYINPYWRIVWFYYGEMWFAWVFYLIVDTIGKAWKLVFMSACLSVPL